MLSKILGRHLGNNRGSVLVLSVVLSIAAIALGVGYLNYVFHEMERQDFDVMLYQSQAASHVALIRGLIKNQGWGYVYNEPEREILSNTYHEVTSRYIASPTGSTPGDEFGYGEITTYGIKGFGYVTSKIYDLKVEDKKFKDDSKRSYADWLYITVRETQSYRPQDGRHILRFWGPDTLDGKVHTNDMFHFQDRFGVWPVFLSQVTQCSTRFDPVDAEDFVHFEIEPYYPVSPLYLTVTADSVRKYDIYGLGVSLENQNTYCTEITLMPEGFLVRTRNITGTLGSRNRPYYPVGDLEESGNFDINLNDALHSASHFYPYPYTGALFIEGEAWIAGSKNPIPHYNCDDGNLNETPDFFPGGLDGELTIACSGDMIIPGDVLVHSANADGTVPLSSWDVLGLISERHILVWRNAPDVVRISAGLGAIGAEMSPSAPPSGRCPDGDPSVDGINGTISIDAINCYGETNIKDRLFIYGCLIQRERGLVHSIFEGGNRGYIAKDYMYDPRFRVHAPPHFFEVKAISNYYIEKVMPGSYLSRSNR